MISKFTDFITVGPRRHGLERLAWCLGFQSTSGATKTSCFRPASLLHFSFLRNAVHYYREMATTTEGPDPSTLDRNGVNLEQIISGTRCSPLTLKEFEGFLIHVSSSSSSFNDSIVH